MSDYTWLTTEDVAEQMTVKRNTVNDMCKRGELPATKFGRFWRIRSDLFDQWLARRTNPDPADRTARAETRRRTTSTGHGS